MRSTNTKKGGKASPSPPISASNRGNGIHTASQSYRYIPVDYIRGKITGVDPRTFLEKLELTHPEIEIEIKSKRGVIKKETFTFENIVLTRFDGNRIYFSGSLHTLWNRGKHNANQFSERAFDEVIAKLETQLLLRPENIVLTCLEYGVNITPPMSCSEILNRCFQHKGREILRENTKGEGNYYCAKHERIKLKLYDKGKQFRLPNDTLRIEVKVTNWSDQRAKGIASLADFIAADKTPFIHDLIDRWNEVVFSDPTTPYPNKWHEFTNREYWRELREGCRQKFKRRFDRLKHLNETQGSNIQGQIADLIRANIASLQSAENSKSVTFDNFTQNRVCRLTNLPIDCQRKNSFLLSHAGIEDLIEHDPCTFGHLKKAYLSEKWQKAPIQVQVKEIAHNIRNYYFNRNRPAPGSRNPAQTILELVP